MTISYTPQAIADLQRLREFIGVKDPRAARRAADELRAGIGKLKQFPNMGIPVPRAPNPDIVRDLFIGLYTVRYLVNGKTVTILRVWHDKEAGRS